MSWDIPGWLGHVLDLSQDVLGYPCIERKSKDSPWLSLSFTQGSGFFSEKGAGLGELSCVASLCLSRVSVV